MFEGFYKVRFQLGEAVGRSVMYVRDGKMLGLRVKTIGASTRSSRLCDEEVVLMRGALEVGRIRPPLKKPGGGGSPAL